MRLYGIAGAPVLWDEEKAIVVSDTRKSMATVANNPCGTLFI